MANAVNLSQKTFFVVSGASRGIGRSVAIECASKFAAGSVIVLLARSSGGLEETKAQILARNPTNVTVFLFTIDLTRPTADEIDKILRTALSERNIVDFGLAMIVHNVGTIGDTSKLARESGAEMAIWDDYYSINVFSVIALNKAFLDIFHAVRRQNASNRLLIVNVTSKCGLEPFKSFALYCSGKAAREMYFRVLALEEDDLIVLNYSPGPVDTEMTVDIQANSADSEVRSMFKGLRDSNTILQPIQTTLKFIEVIESGAFKSGDHIDYYDE